MNPVAFEPDAPTSAIAAQSERQAMDWSLVLASQGIEVSIDHDPAARQWALRVPEAEFGRALDAIKRFRLENRAWSWRQQVPGSDLHFHWAALVWVFAMAVLHVLAGGGLSRAEFVPSAARAGEWWRAFTATWLHVDPAHLAMNAIMGALLLGLAMGRFGGGIAAASALLAGAGANALAPLFRSGDYHGLGASGVVMAALGLLTAQMAAWWRQSWRATRWILGGLMAGTWLFLELGTSPRGDVLVHALGFALGVVAGVVFALLPDRWTPRLNRVGWALALAAVVVPWGLALRG